MLSNNSLDITKINASSQLLMLFTMLYVTFNLVGCALLFKVVQIGPSVAPGGIFFLPIVLLIEDIVAEVFGYKISRALLWYILLSSLIFSISTVAIIRLPSPAYWHFDSAYHTVFDPLMRGGPALFIAVLILLILSNKLEIDLLQAFRNKQLIDVKRVWVAKLN